MQTCYNCGTQVPDEKLICPECGALVKRYTTPARREDFFQAAENPAQPTTPVRPVPPERSQKPDFPQPGPETPGYGPNDFAPCPSRPLAWVQGNRLRLGGLLKFWLILCIVAAGYTLMTFSSMMFLYFGQEMYAQSMAEMEEVMPELAAEFALMMEGYEQTLAMVEENLAAAALSMLAAAAHTAGAIWLLAGRSRPALILYVVSGAVLTVALLLGAFAPLGFVCGGGTLATFLLLLRYVPMMKGKKS